MPRSLYQCLTMCLLMPLAIPLMGQSHAELVGRPLDAAPHLLIAQAFHAIDPMHVGLRSGWGNPGTDVSMYITEHRSIEEWQQDPTLLDVRTMGAQTLTIQSGGLEANCLAVEGTAELMSNTEDRCGHGYDVVLDFDGNGALSEGDVLDGGETPGFYLLGNLNENGAHQVENQQHLPDFWHTQSVFYPADIGQMEPQPLVIISHGWTHEYTYYDYLAHHLASHGYVVMSHRNNVGNGGAVATETASQTALENIDVFFTDLAEIAGGALVGRVDTHRLIHMGHSTGGECIVRAYKRLVDGDYVSPQFTHDDIVLLNSFAPVSFLNRDQVSPLRANFHEFFCGADTDVSGEPLDAYVQGLAIFERAQGNRQVTYIHGAGHEDLHGIDGPSWASGPDLIGREATHTVVRPYTLALCELYGHNNRAVEEYFTSNRMEFQPLGIASGVTISGEFRPAWPEGLEQGGVEVLDDHQTNPEEDLSSAGTQVWSTGLEAHEVLMQDLDESFNWTGTNWANGMTRARYNDDPRCATLAWEGEAMHCIEIAEAHSDWSGFWHLAFRIAQLTRHPFNTDAAGLALAVELTDLNGSSWDFPLSSIGRILPPYPRGGIGHYTACLDSGTYTMVIGGSMWEVEQLVTVPGYLDLVGVGAHTFTLENGSPCEEIEVFCYDTWGDGWDSGTFEILDENGSVVLQGTLAAGSEPDLGVGWQNEFHTFQVPLAQIALEGAELDLSHIDQLCFLFGQPGDSPSGAVALDDVALVGVASSASSVQKPAQKQVFNLHPNPAHAWCFVHPPLTQEPWQGKVFDTTGRPVMSWSSAQGSKTLNVLDWQAGTYIVKVMQGSSVQTLTLIVLH
ncbi:MAG: T9SS type A sorting domain-containing protein [Flavobacteriales bacterium]|nr:T9SS type A sorting domain-containing protein [Flavobacteriales bacterium]